MPAGGLGSLEPELGMLGLDVAQVNPSWGGNASCQPLCHWQLSVEAVGGAASVSPVFGASPFLLTGLGW